ncbi:MAG TPA: hypothetical protein VHQ86_00260 [Candidatus Saccharimonadia bacterium]|jgi:hypothetical protein|nr:hypothetical protein [Candidatus Saccharimonadia bacterium]
MFGRERKERGREDAKFTPVDFPPAEGPDTPAPGDAHGRDARIEDAREAVDRHAETDPEALSLELAEKYHGQDERLERRGSAMTRALAALDKILANPALAAKVEEAVGNGDMSEAAMVLAMAQAALEPMRRSRELAAAGDPSNARLARRMVIQRALDTWEIAHTSVPYGPDQHLIKPEEAMAEAAKFAKRDAKAQRAEDQGDRQWGWMGSSPGIEPAEAIVWHEAAHGDGAESKIPAEERPVFEAVRLIIEVATSPGNSEAQEQLSALPLTYAQQADAGRRLLGEMLTDPKLADAVRRRVTAEEVRGSHGAGAAEAIAMAGYLAARQAAEARSRGDQAAAIRFQNRSHQRMDDVYQGIAMAEAHQGDVRLEKVLSYTEAGAGIQNIQSARPREGIAVGTGDMSGEQQYIGDTADAVIHSMRDRQIERRLGATLALSPGEFEAVVSELVERMLTNPGLAAEMQRHVWHSRKGVPYPVFRVQDTALQAYKIAQESLGEGTDGRKAA